MRWIVTCPRDSPFLPLDLVGRLLAAAEAENAELAMPIAEGQFQPVFLLARSDVAESAGGLPRRRRPQDRPLGALCAHM